VEKTIAEIADVVLRELGKPSSLKTIVPDRPSHDRRYLLEASRIRAELGWQPLHDFDDGVAETVRWYADNRDWWEPLRDRRPVNESTWTAAGAR
jgi:dTDP-glucose 4,6-dehydratase